MEIPTFKKVAEALLRKHYGLQLNDTALSDDGVVRLLLDRNFRPFEVVVSIADDVELVRIDVEGPYGTRSSQPITADDEFKAIAQLVKSGAFKTAEGAI